MGLLDGLLRPLQVLLLNPCPAPPWMAPPPQELGTLIQCVHAGVHYCNLPPGHTPPHECACGLQADHDGAPPV